MNPKLIDPISFAFRIRTQRAHPSLYLCLLALALAGAVPSFAATITVTNTNDSGSGSLRNAIATANPGDTIQFSVTGTITLTNGVLTIDKNLIIQGPGAAQLAISGNNASGVFQINSDVTVTISGVTIEKGSANIGGGLYNSGTLTVTNSTLSGNSADGGGAIFNTSALTLTNSTFSGNSAVGACSGGEGGGINNTGGTVTVTNSTLLGNSAANEGGGIDNNNGGTLAATNSTIAGNSAPNGGGIDNWDTTTLKSTLLANNAPGGSCALFGGAIISKGYNLSDDNTCASFFTGPGDQYNVVKGAGLDPKGPQNNGGPTQTIALLPTSPAVDAIPVANCTDPQGNKITTDQRGVTRPQGKGCDIGAFELVQTVPFSSFNAYVAIDDGRHPGFVMTSTFTLGSGSTGLQPASEAMTLHIANYTLTLPAGSFHKLWNASNAPYGYEGTVNGANVVLAIVPLGNNAFSLTRLAGLSRSRVSGIRSPLR